MSRIERNRTRATAIAVASTLVLLLCGAGQLRLGAQNVSEADRLFQQGLFEKAEPLYIQAVRPSSRSTSRR